MLTLLSWLRSCLSIYSFFLPFHTVFFEKKSFICSPHLNSGELFPLSWGQGIYINYLKFFCLGDLSLFLIYYISMDPRMFVLCLGYNLIWHYLFYCSNCSCFGLGALSVSPCAALTSPHHFYSLSTSLLSGITRFSRCTLHILCPGPRNTHFSKES